MGMVELIDRVALIKAINADKRGKTIHTMRAGKVLLSLQIIWEHLHLAPTVDAVEVVRCKDCRRFVDNKEARVTYCRRCLKDMTVSPDDFCSYGERRTDGTA